MGFFIIVLVVGICLMVYSYNSNNRTEPAVDNDCVNVCEEDTQTIGGTNLDRFFVECVLAECNDFSKEKNIERAKLLAQKYKLSYVSGIERLYDSAFNAHKTISGRITNDRIAAIKKQEIEEYERLNRYAELYGKDKKVTMLTDRMGELRKAADSLDKGAEMMLRSTQTQERDWATWGGIASGIAGVGAGIATAVDIQAQNARIRAQNEANMKAAIPAFMAVSNSAFTNRNNADAIEKQIKGMTEKLVSSMPSEEVFELLNVCDGTVEVSETGALKITATVTAKEKLYIFDDVPAVVDGTLIAHVLDGSQEIGVAKLVLPVNGVEDKTGVVGVALGGGQTDKIYSIKYTAHKLWLMEK